ncbi:hypothetical protein NL676_019195 [Syzygium grande]|nr:hypothetical protein NL676_019195 [Syzygium grande]
MAPRAWSSKHRGGADYVALPASRKGRDAAQLMSLRAGLAGDREKKCIFIGSKPPRYMAAPTATATPAAGVLMVLMQDCHQGHGEVRRSSQRCSFRQFKGGQCREGADLRKTARGW